MDRPPQPDPSLRTLLRLLWVLVGLLAVALGVLIVVVSLLARQPRVVVVPPPSPPAPTAAVTPTESWVNWSAPALTPPTPAEPASPPPPADAPVEPPAAPTEPSTPASVPAPHRPLWFQPAGDLAPADLQRAMDRGIAYLWRCQGENGRWPSVRDRTFVGGATGLAVFALRTAGVPASDPRLQRAAKYLCDLPTNRVRMTYALSTRVLALLAMDPRAYGRQIQADVAMLADIQFADGGWSYQARNAIDAKAPDNSNTQFAVLALTSAAQAGLAVPRPVLQKAHAYFLAMQNADGGFGYATYRDQGSYGSMTAVGLASLVLLDDALASLRPDWRRQREADALGRALAWLDQRFTQEQEVGWLAAGVFPPYYGLYAVERAAHAGGLKRLGGRDWFVAGARYLLRTQQPDGSWPARHPTESDPEAQTSFALLFLAKGLAPTALSKLRYSGDWNATPRDLRHATAWLSAQRERLLTWQVVTAGSPTFAADVHDAPVLCLSGTGPLALGATDRQVLAQFVRQGGTVLAVGDAAASSAPAGESGMFGPAPTPRPTPPRLVVREDGSIVADATPAATPLPVSVLSGGGGATTRPVPTSWPADVSHPATGPFADSVRAELDAALAPLGFRRVPLPADHPLWSALYRLPAMSGAEGWTDGLVWRAFLLPAPLHHAWDLNATRTRAASFELLANVVVLAGEGGALHSRVRPGGLSALPDAPLPVAGPHAAAPWPSDDAPDLQVAAVRHAGGWLAAEFAPVRLAQLAGEQAQLNASVRLGVSAVDLPDALPAGPRLAWISGTADPGFSAADWEALRRFCADGGFVVFDAAGSSQAFANAVRPALRERFGAANVQPLGPDHPLLTGQAAGPLGRDLRRSALRRPLTRAGQNPAPLLPPRPADLYGLRLNGLLVGVYCPHDLAYGVAGGPAPDVPGYTAESSRAIALNLLLAARRLLADREPAPQP